MISIFDPMYRQGWYTPVVHSYYDRADMIQTTPELVDHSHSLCEIMYVNEGRMSIEVKGEEVHVGRGQFIWMDANIRHWNLMFADGLCSMMNIEFQYEALDARAPSLGALARSDAAMADFLSHPAEYIVLTDRDSTVFLLMKEIIQLADSTHKQSERLCSLLCSQTMLEVARLSMQRQVVEPSVNNHYVSEALEIMHSDYAEPLTAASLAARLHIQPTYLHRLFREHTAGTMSEQLQRIRIKQAQVLLCTTDDTLPDIAAAVGISSQQRFSQLFRRIAGLTPAEYRKQCKEGIRRASSGGEQEE